MIPKQPSGNEPDEKIPSHSSAGAFLDAGGAGEPLPSKVGMVHPRGDTHARKLSTRDEDDWPSPSRGTLDGRAAPSVRAEVGAALERQLLLVGEPEDGKRDHRPAMPRGLRSSILILAVLGFAAITTYLVIQARRHWEGKVNDLQGRMTRISEESALREEALRREIAEKDLDISQRKVELAKVAGLAEKTFQELQTSLEDLRLLRNEKTKLESEYRTAVKKEGSLTRYLLAELLPRWLAGRAGADAPSAWSPEATGGAAAEPREARPEGTAESGEK
jgi:hypothetical protein